MTPLRVHKLTAAATVMGWKLSQPGEPIRPMCVAEEFVLELIRREAVAALDLVDAGKRSISATRGVYEVCEDDDIIAVFEMEEPADAALSLSDPVNQMMGKVDMRIENWFEPFFGDPKEVLHPLYLEPERPPAAAADFKPPLQVVESGQPLTLESRASDSGFRVIVRLWEDAFLERHPMDQMPSTWVYYVEAISPDVALQHVRENFPDGATRDLDTEGAESTRLDREDLARASFDVQRVGLPQALSDGRAFYLVGGLVEELDGERLEQLAANLEEAFPQAVVMSDGARAYFGVSINAETHEEADADLEELLEAFCEAAGLEDYPIDGVSNGQGARSRPELIEEIESYRNSS